MLQWFILLRLRLDLSIIKVEKAMPIKKDQSVPTVVRLGMWQMPHLGNDFNFQLMEDPASTFP